MIGRRWASVAVAVLIPESEVRFPMQILMLVLMRSRYRETPR